MVLATPDDEGYRKGRETEKQYRARQNVVLELGLLLATLGRSRVAILLKHAAQMERLEATLLDQLGIPDPYAHSEPGV